MGKKRERSERTGTIDSNWPLTLAAPQGTWEAGYRSAERGEVRVPAAWHEIKCGVK